MTKSETAKFQYSRFHLLSAFYVDPLTLTSCSNYLQQFVAVPPNMKPWDELSTLHTGHAPLFITTTTQCYTSC